MIDVKPADLIMVRGTSPFDRIIEGISHSPYSHCAGLVKPNETFDTQVLRGAEYNGLDFFLGSSDIYTCDTMSDEQRQQAIEYALSKAGSHYGYRLLVWEGFHFILHLDLSYNHDEPPDCSQLWLQAYRHAGIDLCPGLEVASPGDLAQSKLLRCVGPFI